MTFNDESINSLISCEKLVVEAPTRDYKQQNRHLKKDMTLHSLNGEEFMVFIRQSLEFSEDFSLGLVLRSPEGKRITLVRYNGQHEQSNYPIELAKPHFQYHIHKVTVDNIKNGRYEKHPAEPTPRYASFEEATVAFLVDIGLNKADVIKHFPGFEDLPLFRSGGTS